jgi:SAM-dependent methyltransferase
MERVNISSKVEAIFTFKWKSEFGLHEENYFCKINVWRDLDLLPEKLKEQLMGRENGETFSVFFKGGELFPYSYENIIEVESKQFNPPKPFKLLKPRLGRFYPLGFFQGLAGVFSANCSPARIIEIDNEKSKLTIDTNIPIAKYDVDLTIFIKKIVKKIYDIGGECKNWCLLPLENGPGMQVRFDGIATDFEFDNPERFKREDETEDSIFYKEPRITTHIDSQCNENLIELYNRILPMEGKVLDLMSSFQSHFPDNREFYVIGLGLNDDEMKQNRSLNEWVIHDINKNPELPFNDKEFDVVVCDLSIDYITNPFDVVKEIRRVLKPDGVLTFSFSNRYFPQKVIKLWIDLHDFERMGYVLEILLRNGGFKQFQTFSYRGYKRPYDDKYFGCTFLSDPLYVVYAKKA